MGIHLTIAVACLLLIDASCRVFAQDCSNGTQQLCLSYLTSNGLDIAHIDDDLPTWNETADMLQGRCQAFDTFSQCMTGVTEYCTGGLQAKYIGWQNAYDYLCTKSNLTVVAGYLQCYDTPNVQQSEQTVCQNIYEVKLKNMLNGSTSVPPDKWSDYCTMADSFFTCINKTLTTNCGDEAAKWQWNWDRNLNKESLKLCPGWSTDNGGSSGGTSGWTIALIVILVLITAIMILAIGFLMFFLLRKRKQRSHLQQVRRRAQSVAPPPPYCAVVYASAEPGAEPQAHLVDSSVALTPGQLGRQADAVHPPTDVVLPPPYMGDQPPVPVYESIQEAPKQEDNDEEADDAEGGADGKNVEANKTVET